MHIGNSESAKWVAIAVKVVAVAAAIALRALDESSSNNSVREPRAYARESYGLLLLDENGELLAKQTLSVSSLLQGTKALNELIQQIVAVKPTKAVLTVRPTLLGFEEMAKHDAVVELVGRLLGEVDIRLVNLVQVLPNKRVVS